MPKLYFLELDVRSINFKRFGIFWVFLAKIFWRFKLIFKKRDQIWVKIFRQIFFLWEIIRQFKLILIVTNFGRKHSAKLFFSAKMFRRFKLIFRKRNWFWAKLFRQIIVIAWKNLESSFWRWDQMKGKFWWQIVAINFDVHLQKKYSKK